jgi:hypothetical protein
LLHELDRLAANRADFAFESTLSGRSYVGRLRRWKSAGYRIEFVFLRLASPPLGLGWREPGEPGRLTPTSRPVLVWAGVGASSFSGPYYSVAGQGVTCSRGSATTFFA